MNEVYGIWAEAMRVGARCLTLFYWSKSEAQWAQHHVSVTGEWEWYFW